MTNHTITASDDELHTFGSELNRLGLLVLGQVERLDTVLHGTHPKDGEAILRIHGQVLRSQEEAEQLAIRTLAKRQPVANDLRSVVKSIRVMREFSNMSHAACEIASLLLTLSALPMIPIPASLGQMANLLVLQTKRVLAACEANDARHAHEIWLKDQDCDRLHNAAFLEIVGLMARDPRAMRQCIYYIMLARHLARIIHQRDKSRSAGNRLDNEFLHQINKLRYIRQPRLIALMNNSG